jgi:hypothetical protein
MVEASARHVDALGNDDGAAGGNYSLITREYDFRYWRTFLLFATMGAGASWVNFFLYH